MVRKSTGRFSKGDIRAIRLFEPRYTRPGIELRVWGPKVDDIARQRYKQEAPQRGHFSTNGGWAPMNGDD
jgi:hypothetical protein